MDRVIFTVALYGSLAICALGLLLKVRQWSRVPVGPEAQALLPRQRLLRALRGLLGLLAGRRIFAAVEVFFADILFQRRILRDSLVRWLVHMALFWGFLGLLLMHALDRYVTKAIFDSYYPTVNPFLFLRNLFGALVASGVVVAFFRRARSKAKRVFTNASDRYALGILALIVASGFALEAAKIVSPAAFDRMVEEYSTISDAGEIAALKQYWARHFGVVFPERDLPEAAAGSIEQGRTLHNEYCAACHSRPQFAFVSYAAARLARPVAAALTRHRAEQWLWYLHVLSCCLGLAFVPFGKMVHLLASPLSLFAKAAAPAGCSDPANRVTRRAISFDACTHCGACSLHCSVAPVFSATGNVHVLPSEKLIALEAVATGAVSDSETLRCISEGSLACTECYRCTAVCPVGIDLQDLWISSKQELAAKGFVDPHLWIRRAGAARWAAMSAAEEMMPSSEAAPAATHGLLSGRVESVSACVQCQTCTNVCPVVAYLRETGGDPGLTPQQIMNLVRLGLARFALGSRMVWDCATCYLCQEHCPEGIRVADVMYELRNIAYRTLSPYQQQVDKGRSGTSGTGETGEDPRG